MNIIQKGYISETAAAKAHVEEMRKRRNEIATAADNAVESLKVILKGFNVGEVDEALDRISHILKSDMRI